MKKKMYGLAVFVLTVGFTSASNASLIGFEDLQSKLSFYDWGSIQNTYEGYLWGYSSTPGPAGRVVPHAGDAGWASHTVTSTATTEPNTMPVGLGGTAAAWNWDGTQSLWIDFGEETDFVSGLFAVLSTSTSYSPYNASTIQLFGYDSGLNQVDSSAVLNLSNTFQLLEPNFSNIYALEIRADADYKWFSVDNLLVNESSSVPEPTTVALLGLSLVGLVGLGIARKKKMKESMKENIKKKST